MAIMLSFALKGTSTEGSDLDLLELRESLGRDVGIVTYRWLHSRLREQVLQEQVAIL